MEEGGGADGTEILEAAHAVKKPLEGRTVVVTRPADQADDLVRPLEELGAEVVRFPTIRIVPARDPEPLLRAAKEMDEYDWLVFTSVNGVEAFGKALQDIGFEQPDESLVSPRRVCAIGPATGAALETIGLEPRVIPEEFVAEAVVDALAEEGDLSGKRILLPRAAVAREALPEGLRTRGAEVDVVEAYRTVQADPEDAESLRRRVREGTLDLLTFTASSTVRHFHDLIVGESTGDVPAPPVPVAAIGPITAGTARELGYDVVTVAREYTIPGLIAAVTRWAETDGGPEGGGT